MEPRLSLSQTQKLVLSPQMRQYLRLLQLPVMELEHAIEQELIENPVLDESSLNSQEEASGDGENTTSKVEELRFDEANDPTEQLDENFQEFKFPGT